MTEEKFKEYLARILSNPPFNHDIYFHEGKHRNKFTISNSSGYIDLLMRTNPIWRYHSKFPIVGIEIKIAQKLGRLIENIGQIDKYYGDLSKAKYYINKQRIDAPKLFLVATDDLFYDGYFYCWNEPRVRNKSEDFKIGWWAGLTEFYDRVLWKRGAALLRKDYFLFHQKRYSLQVDTLEEKLFD